MTVDAPTYTPRRAVATLLALVLIGAAGCTGKPAGQNDPAAAAALFDRAVVADLNGDAIGAEDLMFELASTHPDTPHGRAARSRLASSGGTAMIGVAGIIAAVAIPAFMKYVRRSKTVEATMNVRLMFDAAVAFYHEEHAGPDGQILPRRFPQTTPLSPDREFCADGDEGFRADPKAWTHPGWQELNFALEDQHYFRYEFVSKGTGADAIFTARALGDLDCDGVLSTFERVGVIDAEGNVNGGAGLFVANELE